MFSVIELYTFAVGVRRKFLDKLDSIPWEKAIQNREASHYSMRNIILHMIDNEDWIVNWVLKNKAREYKRSREWEDYPDVRTIREHMDEVESRTKAYFQTLDDGALSKRVDFQLMSGPRFNLSVEESLFQCITEQLYHTGELIALLWQENIEPPKMQWFNNNPRAPVA